MQIINKFIRSKLFRFLCVGGGTTLLDFLVFNILIAVVGLQSLVANLISVTVNILLSFYLNKSYVFQSQNNNVKSSVIEFLRFFIATGIGVVVVQTAVIYFLTRVLSNVDIGIGALLIRLQIESISVSSININIAKAVAILAGMSWNFGVYNYLVFNKKQLETSDEQ